MSKNIYGFCCFFFALITVFIFPIIVNWNTGFPVGQNDVIANLLGHEGEGGFKGMQNGDLWIGFTVMEVIHYLPGGEAIGGLHDWAEVSNSHGLLGSTVYAIGSTYISFGSLESPF